MGVTMRNEQEEGASWCHEAGLAAVAMAAMAAAAAMAALAALGVAAALTVYV